jgi:hypothetical protein
VMASTMPVDSVAFADDSVVILICDPSLEGVFAEGHEGTQELKKTIHTKLFFRPDKSQISRGAYEDLFHAFSQCQDVLVYNRYPIIVP